MNEKIKAFTLMTAALKQVDAAMEAIEAFADAYDLPMSGETIPVEELALLVGKKTGVSPFCTEKIIRSALGIIKDLNLTVTIKKGEDDE